MFGEFSPRLPSLSATDSSLSFTKGGTKVAVNPANTFNWSGSHYFNSLAQFSSTTYFYTYPYFWYGSYNYGTWYNYGSMYMNGWVQGAIAFIDDSYYLNRDADDFFRNNSQKRYGFGIGSGDTLLAKVHIVGATVCGGTPNACSTFGDSSSCTAQAGCSWTTYGSCYTFGDETSCNAQPGCLWSGGSSCSIYNGDQSSCESTSGCSWDPNYSNCSDYNGNQGTCEMTGGCSWNANTCGGYGNPTDCNNASPCSWSYQDCTDFNGNEAGCTGASGCTWNYSDCHTFDGTDQATCEANSGCSWDSGMNVCNGQYNTSCSGSYGGSCGGDNSSCSGTYISSYSCNGTYGAGCNENYVCTGTPTPCSNYTTTDEATCEAQTGCVWDQEPAVAIDRQLILINVPTSSSGLTTGMVWSNSGVLTIV